MNPLGAPKDYPEMLLKIVVYTFVGALFFTTLAGYTSPHIGAFLKHFSVNVSILGISNIPIGYVVPPLIVALLARVTKLHDRISDLFGIRKIFDVQEILLPLAGGVGVSVNLAKRRELEERRDEIMGKVFYKYASSTKPAIDPHLIIMALDKWSWFWILIELIAVSSLALVALLFTSAYHAAAWVATIAFLAVLVASFINQACAPMAHAQVGEILANQTWRTEIKAVLDAL